MGQKGPNRKKVSVKISLFTVYIVYRVSKEINKLDIHILQDSDFLSDDDDVWVRCLLNIS